MWLLFMQVSLVLFLVFHTNAQKFRVDYIWSGAYESFYSIHTVTSTWYQARQICEAEGTNLFVPLNIDEANKIKALTSNMKAYHTAVFIGIHDQFTNGNYVNLTGHPIKGTDIDMLWGEGLPDNQDGEEHCAIMTREGLFDDKRCDDAFPFICRILRANTHLNEQCNNFDAAYKLENNGKCYKFHKEPLAWPEAYLVCTSEESQLMVISSSEEATIVARYLSDHLINSAPDPDILLLGFSDLMFPFQYRTINGQTLEEAGFDLWNPLIKNNKSKIATKRCGAISRTGFLQVTSCDQPAMFLCETSLD